MEQSRELSAVEIAIKHSTTLPSGISNIDPVGILKAMEEYAKQEVLSELQALVELQCHPEYLRIAIMDRISEIKNPSQLP